MNILGEKLNIHKKFFSKIGFNYLVMGIVAIICQILIVNLINITHPEYLANINILSGLSSFCNYVLPFPIFYWLMKKLESYNLEKTGINVKKFITYIGISLTLMWIGNIIGLAITALLSGAIQTDISNPVQNLINSADIWFNIIVISIVAPIFEETFFRKFLIDRTIKYGARASIILSAVIFAFFHGNLNQFFYALLIGGFFAYVYIKTGKITYPIILHGIVNFMGSVVSLFIASSATKLQSGFNMLDASIIIVYFLIICIFIIIGVLGLSNYKNAKFNGTKTEINLKSPLKTMFLNYGMILFIGFFIFEIIRQTLI